VTQITGWQSADNRWWKRVDSGRLRLANASMNSASSSPQSFAVVAS